MYQVNSFSFLAASCRAASPSKASATPAKLTPNAAIDTYDDHRMAMCFSLVSLGGVPVRINDPKCVGKTFPDYFERFLALAQP